MTPSHILLLISLVRLSCTLRRVLVMTVLYLALTSSHTLSVSRCSLPFLFELCLTWAALQLLDRAQEVLSRNLDLCSGQHHAAY